MKVTGSSIQQLEKDKPKSKCRKWRLWATTECGRKSKRFTGTYTEAQNALREWVSELEGLVPNPDTFESYARSWHRWRVESGDYSPNTMAAEATSLNAVCRTEIAGMKMDEITPDACRGELLWLKTHPERGSEYKPSSMGKFHQVLFEVMQQAVDDGKLARNPMASVKRPRVRVAEREALSPDELQLFLNRVDELPTDGRTVALYMMACLGLRCGEACALRDEQFGETATVDSTVRAADRSIGRPKSAAGARTLPVPPRLAAKVGEWREVRRRIGLDGSETLCCNKRGGVMTTSAMENWWRCTARAKLGCDGMTLHQLRHSNLSMMARHMSVFDLQRYAGWSSIAPARIYVHDDLDAVTRAVEMAWK